MAYFRGLIVGLGMALALIGPRIAIAGAKVGGPAPKFTVVTFDRQKFSSDDLKGKVVILNYWAPWCAPCRAETLVYDAYMRRHPGTDLKVFAIDEDRSIPDAKLRPLAKLLSYPLIVQLKGSGYGLIKEALPTSYVIDRSGVVRRAAAGAFDEQSLDDLVTPLLAAAPPPS